MAGSGGWRFAWCCRATTRHPAVHLRSSRPAPEFVIIDDVTLAEGPRATSRCTLTLDLSTYYRLSATWRLSAGNWSLLGALVVVALIGAVAYDLLAPRRRIAPGLPRRGSQSGRRAPAARRRSTAPDVHLEALQQGTPPPERRRRANLFRFKREGRRRAATATPCRPDAGGRADRRAGRRRGPPPIPLKFIGIVEATAAGADRSRC